MEPGLRSYVLRRLGFAALMLVGVSMILFAIMRLAPGGPEAVLVGGEFSTEAAARIRQRLGLDRPLALQYATWAAAAVRGDLGRSFKTGDPVATLIADRLGPTLQLTGGALLFAVAVAVPLGVLAAVRRGTAWDTLGSAVSLFGVSFPSFWLGIMLILLFSEALPWLPPSGLAEYGREGDVLSRVRHAVLPTLTLGLIQMAAVMRFTRSSLLEALRQDYVRTARAKGLADGRVVWRHALRNALIPVVTVIGLSLPTLVGGAVLTETVFAWPGIGRLAVGAVAVAVMLAAGVLAPAVAPYSYSTQSLTQRLQPPGRTHWLGTDGFGRDVLSRVIWGSRVSLEIGFLATALSLVVGSTLGSVAGYFGGAADTAIMRAADVFLSVPALFLILIVVALFGASLANTALVIALVTWAPVGRIVRSECLSLRKRDFVHAAAALGAGHARILSRHLLANALPIVIVQASLLLGQTILIESGLSYLGLGARPPLPSWGNMVVEGRQFLASAWWIATFPGLAIFVTVLGFHLFGDGLRDASDPTLRGRL